MNSPLAQVTSDHAVPEDLDARGEPVMTAEDFTQAFRLHPGGVALVTADDGAGPAAFTASSVSSVSADPPLLMFSLSVNSSSMPTITRADTIVVHLLSADDKDLAELGAARGEDRFADRARWTRLVTGEPVFCTVRAWIRARILHRIDAGGSTVVVARALQTTVKETHLASAQDGLVYRNRTWHRIGDQSRI